MLVNLQEIAQRSRSLASLVEAYFRPNVQATFTQVAAEEQTPSMAASRQIRSFERSELKSSASSRLAQALCTILWCSTSGAYGRQR